MLNSLPEPDPRIQAESSSRSTLADREREALLEERRDLASDIIVEGADCIVRGSPCMCIGHPYQRAPADDPGKRRLGAQGE